MKPPSVATNRLLGPGWMGLRNPEGEISLSAHQSSERQPVGRAEPADRAPARQLARYHSAHP
ncbi:hypothetical protein MSIMFI_04692 [Mycobacterium simulans]|nr:hypothetical protein MSIMFI_04692 [Mycobacterium simulans]